MDPKGPEQLSEIISRLFAARGWGRQQERLRFEQAWKDAVGAQYAPLSRINGLRRHVLEVEVKGAVVVQELSFNKRKILAQLRTLLPGTTISDIRFRAASW